MSERQKFQVKLKNMSRRNRPERTPFQVYQEHLSRAFSNALIRAKGDLPLQIRNNLLTMVVDFEPSIIKGKNLDILAFAMILLYGSDIVLNPDTYRIEAQKLVGNDQIMIDEVLMYIFFLKQIDPSGRELPYVPPWANSWMPYDLYDPYTG